MNYQLSDVEASWLLDLVIAKAAEVAARMVPQEHPPADTHKPTFLLWCRIAAELSEPSASMPPAAEPAPARVDRPLYGLEGFMPELARREGLDFDKEFGPMDPRALAPRCTHGLLFTDECAKCADRCEHGLERTMPCAACGRGVAASVDVMADRIGRAFHTMDGPRVDGGEFDELTRELLPAKALWLPADGAEGAS